MKDMRQTLECEITGFITVSKPPSQLGQNLGRLCVRATHTIHLEKSQPDSLSADCFMQDNSKKKSSPGQI